MSNDVEFAVGKSSDKKSEFSSLFPLALFVWMLAATSSNAFETYTVDGHTLQWNKPIVTFGFDESCPQVIRDGVAYAAQQWPAACGYAVALVESDNPDISISMKDAGASLAFTKNSLLNYSFTHSEIAFSPVAWDLRTAKRYALHELGHALGLNHSDGGIMQAEPQCDELQADDIAGIESLYPGGSFNLQIIAEPQKNWRLFKFSLANSAGVVNWSFGMQGQAVYFRFKRKGVFCVNAECLGQTVFAAVEVQRKRKSKGAL